MARTQYSVDTSWVDLGAGPMIVQVNVCPAGSFIWVNNTNSETAAKRYPASTFTKLQRDIRSDGAVNVWVKASSPGWVVIADND